MGQVMAKVAKDDWYFILPMVFAIAAFFGVDWKFITNQVAVPPSDLRQGMAALLAVVSFALSGIAWSRARRRRKLGPISKTIYGQKYANEKVPIDGTRFDHCHFENVRLFFRGLARAEFLEITTAGTVGLETDNEAIKWFHVITGAMQQHSGAMAFQSFNIDEHGNLTPLGPLIKRVPPEGKREGKQ